MITAAITAEQEFRAEHSHQHTAELTAVTSQIRTAEAAIDRYLAAFENATLDEAICGHRIRDLTAKIEQLTARRTDLTEVINSQPKPPSADAISQLRRTLANVLQHGTPGQRKAIIETHIGEIKIQGALLIPIFLITADDEGPAETSADPDISHNIKVVEPRGLEPRHPPCKSGALPAELWPPVRPAAFPRCRPGIVYGIRCSILRNRHRRACRGIARAAGFEPATHGFGGRCSTN